MLRSALLVPLVLAIVVSCRNSSSSGETQPHYGTYSNTELGFSFTPPSGFRDLTAASNQAEGTGVTDDRPRFQFLLRMASGPDDTAPDWLSLGIVTYPRGRDRDKSDDVTASFITNQAFASGLGGQASERKVVKISGMDFVMTRVERNEPPLTKHAIVYTTVYRERFLSFFFAGNSRDNVEKVAQSINSVRFGI